MTSAPVTIRVQVQLFARYEELLGRERLDLDLPPGATLADAVARVRALPGGDALPESVLAAVNLRQAPPDTELRQGDEVALLPPMAGG